MAAVTATNSDLLPPWDITSVRKMRLARYQHKFASARFACTARRRVDDQAAVAAVSVAAHGFSEDPDPHMEARKAWLLKNSLRDPTRRSQVPDNGENDYLASLPHLTFDDSHDDLSDETILRRRRTVDQIDEDFRDDRAHQLPRVIINPATPVARGLAPDDDAGPCDEARDAAAFADAVDAAVGADVSNRDDSVFADLTKRGCFAKEEEEDARHQLTRKVLGSVARDRDEIRLQLLKLNSGAAKSKDSQAQMWAQVFLARDLRKDRLPHPSGQARGVRIGAGLESMKNEESRFTDLNADGQFEKLAGSAAVAGGNFELFDYEGQVTRSNNNLVEFNSATGGGAFYSGSSSAIAEQEEYVRIDGEMGESATTTFRDSSTVKPRGPPATSAKKSEPQEDDLLDITQDSPRNDAVSAPQSDVVQPQHIPAASSSSSTAVPNLGSSLKCPPVNHNHVLQQTTKKTSKTCLLRFGVVEFSQGSARVVLEIDCLGVNTLQQLGVSVAENLNRWRATTAEFAQASSCFLINGDFYVDHCTRDAVGLPIDVTTTPVAKLQKWFLYHLCLFS